jgi:hypothetical protein
MKLNLRNHMAWRSALVIHRPILPITVLMLLSHAARGAEVGDNTDLTEARRVGYDLEIVDGTLLLGIRRQAQ